MTIFNNLQDKFESEEFSLEKLSDEVIQMMPLIPDQQEYQEQFIDYRLQWISDNDPQSRLKNFDMVDYQCEIDFFENRQQELARERNEHISQRTLQSQQEIDKIKTLIPPESIVPQRGPEHFINDKIQQWREQEIRIQAQKADKDIQLIAGLYNSLQEQCNERINQARANYQEALRLWREERNQDQNELEF